jgi:oligoribonuclease (3'-5' exoribonuclease)
LIVFVDTETSGLNERQGALLEVALIVTDDDLNELSHISTVVRPVVSAVELQMDDVVKTMHTRNGLLAELAAGNGMRLYEAEEMLIAYLTAACDKCDGSGWVVRQSGFDPPERDGCPNCCNGKSGKLGGMVELDYCVNCKKKRAEHISALINRDYCPGSPPPGFESARWSPKQVTRISQTPLAGSTVGFDCRWLREHMPKLEALFSYRSVDVSSFTEMAKRWAPEIYKARPKAGAAHRALADVRESIAYLKYYRNTGFVLGSAGVAK